MKTRGCALAVISFLAFEMINISVNAHSIIPQKATTLEQVATFLKLPANVITNIESLQDKQEKLSTFLQYFQNLQKNRDVQQFQIDYMKSQQDAHYNCMQLCKQQEQPDYCIWNCDMAESKRIFMDLTEEDVQLLFGLNAERFGVATTEGVLQMWNRGAKPN